jgi:hypothetical protein
MPKSNEEEAAPVPMSTLVDWVSEAAEQLETVKLSDHDEAWPHADTTAGDTNPKEDPELWKPPSPTEECPVCLVPLPLKPDKAMYWACCGKRLCMACATFLHLLSNRFERLSVAMVYFSIHPASE